MHWQRLACYSHQNTWHTVKTGHVVTVPAESAGAYKLYKLGARVTLPQLAISSGAGTCTLPREQALAPLSAYRHLWEPIAEAIRCHPQ